MRYPPGSEGGVAAALWRGSAKRQPWFMVPMHNLPMEKNLHESPEETMQNFVAYATKFCNAGSTAGDDFDNFQPVTRIEPAPGKFRRRNRLAVVLHHHAPRQQVLRNQKFLNRARQLRLDRLSVGGDNRIHGFTKSFEILLKTMSSLSPKV